MRVLELHCSLKPVQRGDGGSCTQNAAYLSGSHIRDERTGLTHDYTKRSRHNEIEHAALMLPDNAPEWAHDRRALWNAVEAREKHPRAQPGRKMIVTFPYEFSAVQRREAAYGIAEFIIHRHGAAVDLGIHRPDKRGDPRNFHLHVLFAGRRFDENGNWAKAKDRTLDDRFGKGADEVFMMREHAAHVMNNIAARDKLGVYVEHRSYEDRGLDREPTQHMGQIATQKERLGQQTDIGDKNRAVKKRNDERSKLYEEQKVVDIAIAKILRNEPEEEIARPQYHPAFHTEAWAEFYGGQAKRRAALLEDLDRKFGQQEKDAIGEIVKRHQSIEGGGIFRRFWRRMTGKTREDQVEINRQAAILDAIQSERLKAQEKFELERFAELQKLAAAERGREASGKVKLAVGGKTKLSSAERARQFIEKERARSKSPDRDWHHDR